MPFLRCHLAREAARSLLLWSTVLCEPVVHCCVVANCMLTLLKYMYCQPGTKSHPQVHVCARNSAHVCFRHARNPRMSGLRPCCVTLFLKMKPLFFNSDPAARGTGKTTGFISHKKKTNWGHTVFVLEFHENKIILQLTQ